MMRSLRRYLCSSALALLIGCSSKTIPQPPQVTQSDPEVPFKLEVLREINDGMRLYVHARLVPRLPWDPTDIAVRLVGSDHGEEIGSDLFTPSGSPAQAELVRRGDPVEFALSIPTERAADYQLEALWGKETSLVRRDIGGIKDVVVTNVQREELTLQCDLPPCAKTYVFHADLTNEGARELKKVVIGTGYIWVPAGRSLDNYAQIPENEELIEVAALLPSGESRPIKLVFDQPVPFTSGGAFLPSVRVVSVE